MKPLIFFFCIILFAAPVVTAQIELVSGDYFPADLEFTELQKIISEENFEDPSLLAKIEEGGLIADVGFSHYAKRVYSTVNSHPVSIEIATLLDSRAAFSLLTLLRTTVIQEDFPGDSHSTTTDGILFCQGKKWVRIQGRGTPENLLKRIAISVSNRIGPRRLKPPSLVSHFPKQGFNLSSLRYYPGVKAYQSYSARLGNRTLSLPEDAEIAQAGYSLDSRTGILTLFSFPTAEVAEEYIEGLAGQAGKRLYLKRAGPIVGVLEGPFEPGTADRVLSSIRYSYSVQWVYEKSGKPKTAWGVPAGILTTVVKSLFFVVIIFGISILVGIGYAAFRVMLKRRASKQSPDQPDETEITHLRMR
jgi:hypothetical protein